jgi:hypothetical protein
MQIDEPPLGQSVLRMTPVVLAAEMGSGRPRRATPEWKQPTRDTPVQRIGDLKAVVGVALVVPKQMGDLVPDGTPRRPGEGEPPGEARGITEREVEADKNPLPASHRRRQPIAEN